jgi:hypothetical protein
MRVWVAIGFLSVVLLGALTFTIATYFTSQQTADVTVSAQIEIPEIESVRAVSPSQKMLRILSPCFSREAEYSDCAIRLTFEASYTVDGRAESRLAFWLRNTSAQVIAVVWDRCSIQLPDGDTVNVVHEDQLGALGAASSPPTTLAPGGDLFDAVFPVSEVAWTNEGWIVSSGVLDQGPFSFILALDMGGRIQYYVFRFLIR